MNFSSTPNILPQYTQWRRRRRRFWFAGKNGTEELLGVGGQSGRGGAVKLLQKKGRQANSQNRCETMENGAQTAGSFM